MVNKRQQQVQKRRKASASQWLNEEDSGKGGEPTCYKLPEGFSEFEPEEGVYEVDLVDYVVGKHNRRADEGMLHYELEINQHWLACTDGKRRPYVCLQTFKKRCPACEKWNATRPGDADDETRRGWRGKTMHLMLLRVLKKDGKPVEDVGFQLWCANHYNKGKGFGEQLIDLLRGEPDKVDTFSTWEDGCSLKLTFKSDSFGGNDYVYVSRIDFVPRKHQYDDSIENQLVCLDELLIQKSYEQLKSVVESGGEDGLDDEAPEAAPAKGNSRREEPEPHSEPDFAVGDFVKHPDHGRCEVVALKNGAAKLEDDKGRQWTVNADECDASPEEPSPKSRPPVASKNKAPKEEEDPWGPEEDEQPKPKGKR